MSLRVAYWAENDANPYQRLFHEALRGSLVPVRGLSINDEALRRMRSEIDAVHFHWPEYIWRVEVHSELERSRRVLGFWRFLRMCRHLQLPIIWTVHNVRPHEFNWLDRLGVRVMGAQSDLIIAHSDSVARLMRQRHSRAVVVMMPHGNHDGIYPAPRLRETVLRELALSPLLPTVVLAGTLRGYKGIKHALEAVDSLGGRVQLIIAGKPHERLDVTTLVERARASSWLRVLAHELSQQEFVDVSAAGTAILLPYTRVTTSSALLSAWTLGRSVVTSPEPFFKEFAARHPGAAEVSADYSPSALAAAITAHLTTPEAERWSAARRAADAYTWSRCVEPVRTALDRIGNQLRNGLSPSP